MSISTLQHLVDPAACPRLVIKVGSALLVGKNGKPRSDWLASLVAEIARAKAAGQQIIVVSSGAIALGAARLGLKKGGRGSLADAQAAAAVGQIALAELWSDLLGGHGIIAAQILLTIHDLEDRRRYLNASATLGRLMKAGAVPIVNENDSVATQEIRFGDNDRLAARVAVAARAGGVLLLSDVDGLYDRNPAEAGASLLPQIEGVSDETYAMADDRSASGLGSGGMTSKLQAAEIAERAGIALAIVNGIHPSPISCAMQSDTGTLFVPQRNEGAWKAWLGGRTRMDGVLKVDAGCIKALNKGGSLLAAGIIGVSGDFGRGDPVAVQDSDGRIIAQGLSEYTDTECRKIQGLRTKELHDVLGYSPRSAVIHRDQLVLM